MHVFRIGTSDNPEEVSAAISRISAIRVFPDRSQGQ